MAVLIAGTGTLRAQEPQPRSVAPGFGEALRFDYVGYRPACYETERVTEPENERPNRGGLVHVYFTNLSDRPISLRFWRLNGKDESHWRLDGFLAWDRCLRETIPPGEMSVLEINGISEEFAAGKPFRFSYIDRTWQPRGLIDTALLQGSVQISCIRVLSGLAEVELHVRHTGNRPVTLESVAIIGSKTKAVRWTTQNMRGVSHAIARITLECPLIPSQLMIARLDYRSGDELRSIYAHRRAFEDWFPIGCWTLPPSDKLAILPRHHIDLIVRGGRSDDEFYSREAARYGLRTMVPSGLHPDIDTIRSLGNHSAVACWMLTDEPDWSRVPTAVLVTDDITRRYNDTKPTFLTLCRNVKFFEYASIVDIPCMDHYCVTAPTSSRWPKPYGTRLEETAYYTRDLKAASEPKPIWIWSQALADWSERPKRPVPTPEELAAQLCLNVGRGAKGILWFNFDLKTGERFPDTRAAVQHWGRVLRILRHDLLAAEPITVSSQAPPKLDVAALVNWDKLILVVTNLDYQIHDKAYPWTPVKEANLSVNMPEWIKPALALDVDPKQIRRIPFRQNDRRVELSLGDVNVCRIIVLVNDAPVADGYDRERARAVADETRDF